MPSTRCAPSCKMPTPAWRRSKACANGARLSHRLREEFEGAVEGELGAFGVEAAALVAGEAVARLVDVDRHVRSRLPHLLDIAHGDALIGLAEMEQHRRVRLFVGM